MTRRGYTKQWHRAKIGSTEPALCGKRPPRGRAWKEAPKDLIDECPQCAFLASPIWLAA